MDVLTHYRQEQGVYCIDMRVRTLDDFFAPYDPSLLSERDLHPSIVEHLFREMVIFPSSVSLQIVFHVPKTLKKHASDIRSACKRHFTFEFNDNDLHMQRRLHKARLIFAAALVLFMGLIGGSFVIGNYMPDHWVWHLLSEGLFVGAWVSMWHPIHLLLYEWMPLHENKNVYKRLMDTPVTFVYS